MRIQHKKHKQIEMFNYQAASKNVDSVPNCYHGSAKNCNDVTGVDDNHDIEWCSGFWNEMDGEIAPT